MENYLQYPCETLKLTTRSGGKERVPAVSGLNWGQRAGRDPNQAYLPIPATIQSSGFFPDSGYEFELICDDSETFRVVRAQANGKGLHSLPSNSIMGLYFRRRLNLPSGALLVLQHLIDYGRLSVDIYKLPENRYFLDFATQ